MFQTIDPPAGAAAGPAALATSSSSAAERSGPVTISRELFDFLMGAGGIDGVHFGEDSGDRPGPFWWRKLLRAADAGGDVADIEAAIEPIRHWYDGVDHEQRPLLTVVTDMVFDIQGDRKLLTAMRSALLSQDVAEATRNCCHCACASCAQAFRRAADLRHAALTALDGDANRYLALVDLEERAG